MTFAGAGRPSPYGRYAYAAVEAKSGELDSLILPPYAPELNPVETRVGRIA